MRDFTPKGIGRELFNQLVTAKSVKRRVWASQIGWCKRRVYLAMRGEEFPSSYQATLRMGESSAVHDFIQDLLMDAFGGRQNHTVVWGPIIGKADYISPNNIVVEIKALKHIPKQIPQEYLQQLKATISAFHAGLSFATAPAPPSGILLLIDKTKMFNVKEWSKEKQPLKAVEIIVTQSDMTEIERRANEILEAINEIQIPDREGQSPHDDCCMYCSYQYLCYKMEGIEWLNKPGT